MRDDQQRYNPLMYNFIDAINILSFIVGLQNMGLNATANDLERISSEIIDKLNGHLEKQDKRLEKIEYMLSQNVSDWQKGEN